MAAPPISLAPLDTPIGQLLVAVSSVGLVSVTRGNAPGPEADAARGNDPGALARVIDELGAYFEGRGRSFGIPLDLRRAGSFDAAVWTAAREIPYGETVAYGELAAMAGHPQAARAAGNAMARCPFSPVVPCHRVIRADGSIGGWGPHSWVKRWLLDHERAVSTG